MPDKDEIEGRLKRTGGALTDDEKLEREGEAQEAWGDAKDKTGDAWKEAKKKM